MLLEHLEKIEDPRRAQGRRYPLKYLLLFAILAILSGGRSYRDVGRFMDKKREKLNELFGLSWKKAPSKSQIRDIFCAINITHIESSFRMYSQSLNDLENDLEKEHPTHRVGLDGKSLRGSFDHVKGKSMLQMLGAFCAQTQLILGHVDIAEKTNEIPTAQQLIKELGLPEGTLYTADALHCQKKHLMQ